MKIVFKQFKTLSAGLLAFSFLMAVTLSSCGTATNDSDDSDEATEQVEESAAEGDEHPSGEHPTGEHPTGGDEHPSDSTASEHPEHPDSDDEQ